MREWFNNLDNREQAMVGGGTVLVALMFYWLLVWDPMARNRQDLNARIAESRELIAYLQQVGAEAQQYAGSAGSGAQDGNRSLLATVDSSSKQAGLGQYIKRIQPEGQRSVRLWIEGAPFEGLARWLAELRQTQSIVLDNGSLDGADRAGTVKARLTLVRSGS